MNFSGWKMLSVLLILVSAETLAFGKNSAAAMRSEQLLAYDSSLPLEVKIVGSETRDGVTVEDITFRGVVSPQRAFMVRPSGRASGPFAGVLFVHWFAPPDPTSNRTQFLDEAKALARRGTISLLVSAFWEDEARYRARRWQDDYQNSINQAKELRRALDLLLAQPGIDARRIGFVGHDYGAMFGAAISAADARPKAYALIAGASRFPDWYLYGTASGLPKGADLTRFREQFTALDPSSVVGASKAAFLFQYGEDDSHTPRENFVALYLAAPTTKRLLTYASAHKMEAEEIRRDRTAWLSNQLSLPNVKERLAQSTFLVIYKPGPSWLQGKPMDGQPLKEHGRYMLSMYAKGSMKMAGPFGDNSGGAWVLEAANESEAKEIVAEDPAVKTGVFQYELHAWPLVAWEKYLKK